VLEHAHHASRQKLFNFFVFLLRGVSAIQTGQLHAEEQDGAAQLALLRTTHNGKERRKKKKNNKRRTESRAFCTFVLLHNNFHLEYFSAVSLTRCSFHASWLEFVPFFFFFLFFFESGKKKKETSCRGGTCGQAREKRRTTKTNGEEKPSKVEGLYWYNKQDRNGLRRSRGRKKKGRKKIQSSLILLRFTWT
jgi:hypothetical protein